MRVRLTLPAGAPGTKRLVEEYGERLICVRYRYDEKRRRRLKTAEIVVDDVPWAPSPQAESHQLVYVAIEYREWELRERIKEAGGSWLVENSGVLEDFPWLSVRVSQHLLSREVRVRPRILVSGPYHLRQC
jgi:hypothetical protein